jgi:hypothetical protein
MMPLAIVAASFLGLAAGQESLPDASTIEQQVFRDRRAIVSGQIEFHSRIWRFPNDKRQLYYDVRTMIWFDKENLRSDEFSTYKVGSQHPHREIRSFTAEKFTYWSDEKLQDDKPIGVSLMERKSVKNYPTYGVVHPRLVGLSPGTFLNLLNLNNDLESAIARNDRTPPTVKRTSWKGKECLLVEYRLSNDVEKKIYYSPECGLNPVYVEVSDAHSKDSLECTLAMVGRLGIWYPTSCVYQQVAGGRIVEEENLEVIVHQMNEPPESKVFSLEGMNLPAGTVIFRYPEEKSGERLIWNGEKMVQLNESGSPTEPPATDAKSIKRPFLFLISCSLAVIVALILFVYRMKQRPRGSAQ